MINQVRQLGGVCDADKKQWKSSGGSQAQVETVRLKLVDLKGELVGKPITVRNYCQEHEMYQSARFQHSTHLRIARAVKTDKNGQLTGW